MDITEKLSEKKKFDVEAFRKKIGLPLAAILTLLVWFSPAQNGLSAQGHGALALFTGIFVLYLTESIHLAITSLAIVPLAVLMGVTTPAVALGGFASTSVYLIVGAFILGAGMIKSKLVDRLAYVIMDKVGTSVTRISLGVLAVNVVLAFFIPSSTARVAVILPVCVGIIKQFGIEGRSKLTVNLLLVLTFTNATISSGILTATIGNVIAVDLISKAGGGTVTYGDWFKYGFPPAVIMTAFTWWVIQRMYKPEIKEIPGGKAFIKEKLKELGKIKPDEIRSGIVFIIVVLLWATQSITKIDPTISCLLGAFLLFLPKIGFLTWGDANKAISWQILFIAGGGTSLGDILIKTGAAKWLANVVFHAFKLNALPLIGLLVVLLFIVQYSHLLFVGTMAMANAFLPIVIGMAQVAHVSPVILTLPSAMLIGGYPVLMFYNTMPSVLAYGTGRMSVGDFPKAGIIIATVACIFYGICAMTYWSWLGLL